jgi:hypothetical protein
MNKHTPGPWHYKPHGVGSNYMSIFCSSDKGEGDNLRGYCGEPNAMLIAAAPDLLEALQVLSENDFGANGWTPLLERAAIKSRAVIKKLKEGE